MNSTTPSHSEVSRELMIKWIGAALFAGIIVIGGYTVYEAAQVKPGGAENASTASTTTAAQGLPAPVSVKNSSDLVAADQALGSSDLNIVSADLAANDRDLASF